MYPTNCHDVCQNHLGKFSNKIDVAVCALHLRNQIIAHEPKHNQCSIVYLRTQLFDNGKKFPVTDNRRVSRGVRTNLPS